MDFKLNYIDIHSHLNFSQFDRDREEVIGRMAKEGIWTITVGTGLETSKEAVHLAEDNEHLFATVGIHPTDFKEDWNEEFNELAQHLFLKKGAGVVGIGECGLDYYRIEEEDKETKEKQKELFIKHIELALETNLPLMFHFRPKRNSMDAYRDGLEILDEYEGKIRGNSHFFVGNLEIAERFIGLGHTLSFDGPITFTDEYNKVIKSVPLESIMAETDAPYAAPVPHRGKRNEPTYVKYVYEAIALKRGEDVEAVIKKLNQNAIRFWDLT